MCKEVDQSVSSEKPKKDPVRLPPPTAPAQVPENALVPPKRKPAADQNAAPPKAVDDENAELSELQLSDTVSEGAPSKPAPPSEPAPAPSAEPETKQEPASAPEPTAAAPAPAPAPADPSPASSSDGTSSSDEPSPSASYTEDGSDSESSD